MEVEHAGDALAFWKLSFLLPSDARASADTCCGRSLRPGLTPRVNPPHDLPEAGAPPLTHLPQKTSRPPATAKRRAAPAGSGEAPATTHPPPRRSEVRGPRPPPLTSGLRASGAAGGEQGRPGHGRGLGGGWGGDGGRGRGTEREGGGGGGGAGKVAPGRAGRLWKERPRAGGEGRAAGGAVM